MHFTRLGPKVTFLSIDTAKNSRRSSVSYVDLDRVSLAGIARSSVRIHLCTLTGSPLIYSTAYAMPCSRETGNLDCTFAELAPHLNRPLKDQRFPSTFEKQPRLASSYNKHLIRIPSRQANVKTFFYTRALSLHRQLSKERRFARRFRDRRIFLFSFFPLPPASLVVFVLSLVLFVFR